MKTLRMFALITVVATSLFAAQAQAGEISVFFGPEMASTKQVKPFTPFEISIVVSNIDDTIGAVEYKLSLPSNVAIQGSTYWNNTPLVIDGPNGTAVALGECVYLVDAPNFAQQMTVVVLDAVALDTFAETAVTLSEFTGSPTNPGTAPRYANCQDELVNLTPVDGALAGVAVPTEATSFSKVKALF